MATNPLGNSKPKAAAASMLTVTPISAARTKAASAATTAAAFTADAGAAQTFARLHDGRLLHDHSSGAWFEFDGVRWARDDLGRITQHGLAVSRQLLNEATIAMARAASEPNPNLQKHLKEEADKISLAAISLHRKPRLDAMIAMAATDPRIAANRSMFDARDMMIGVQNGTVELGELPITHRDGDPHDMVTRQTGCAYDALALCPTWDSFLERVQPDPGVRLWLRRWAGYCLTGLTSEQSFIVFHGLGANGKSVFAETIKKLLGSYAVSADFATFMAKNQGSDAIRNDLARLDKVRLVVASEGPEGARLDEDLVKRITGGDEITARFLHKEFFSFKPRFKLLLVTNHRPSISGTDHGIWRRVVLVPWTVTIPREEQDRRMAERLEAELPGILCWALQGLDEYLALGLDPLPQTIVAANAEYRKDSDTVGLWIEDACLLDPTGRATTGELYQSYAAWTAAAGHRPMSSKTLGDRLRERGLTPWRTDRARGWAGITLK